MNSCHKIVNPMFNVRLLITIILLIILIVRSKFEIAVAGVAAVVDEY